MYYYFSKDIMRIDFFGTEPCFSHTYIYKINNK